MNETTTLKRGTGGARVEFRFAYTNAWQVFRNKIDAPTRPVIPEAPEERIWLEELERADPSMATTGRIEALERALALELADAQRFDPDEALMISELESFRRSRGLSGERFQAWLEENDLDEASLSMLIYDETSIRRFREAARELVAAQLPNALRAISAYSRFKPS